MASFTLVDRAPELPCANKTSPSPSPAAHPSNLPQTTAPTFRIPAGSKTSKIDTVLQLLRDARLSPFDIIMHILDPSSGSKYRDYRFALYKDNGYRIQALLDALLLDEHNERIFTEWVKPRAVDVVCNSMAEEMTALTRALGTAPSVKALTPAYLRGWSLEKCVAGPAKSIAPTVVRALHTCLNTKEGLVKNKKKKNDTALYTIIAQLASRRSQASSDFSGPMSLFWWQSGCTWEAMEALQSIGLSKCFDTTQDLIESLANYCIADACVLARTPEGSMVNWDNINMSSSIFVEQRSSAPAKVQSGTYTILYRLHNPNPSAMRLAPLLARAESATDLDFNFDVCPTLEQSLAAHSQFRAYVVRVLHRYHADFKSFESDPLLQNHPRRPLPANYRTEQFPIRISTKEESSIPGTLAVHQDIFITQLKFTYAELTKAVLSINDQATQALNRGAMSIRAFDLNPFLRAQIWQLGIGLFHLCLNLIWGILHVHRGHASIDGSLSHLFVILEKTRLGSPHPDYHSLLAALMQILDGLLLDAWRLECGFPTLAAFAASNPSPQKLLELADTILFNHATPTRITRASHPTPSDDIRENTRRLIHDLMYVAEVTRAISAGDFGRVEDLLGNLAMMFRGAGSKNYCTEILYFKHNLQKVWKGDGFDELVRDNMIFNMLGIPGHGQGADMNMEHNIGHVKQLFAAKGMYGDWDRLANISAAIDVLTSVKSNVAISMDASYAGKSHKAVDTSDLVWRVARKAKELNLNETKANRSAKTTTDIFSTGERLLKSSTIATFNKNRRNLLKGIVPEPEEDELPPLDLVLEPPEE
ncbi:hypothetical protein B0H16DRAFT_1324510 [Mycena metata]|uniref:DUF6589 domain-containing protein n=1 Tax=Mycena metata TaxID=1033252 RepID=A0AAD7ID47_9AGAR|nr:hypothetical protein B0H16DRAFT_1324510 [Mycena metata]